MQNKEQEFINAVKDHFESSVAGLDRKTLTDLAAVRAHALNRRPLRSPPWFLVPAGVMIFLALTLVVHKTFLSPFTLHVPVEYDIELMSAQEGLDLYDDIEFYEWLADQGFTT